MQCVKLPLLFLLFLLFAVSSAQEESFFRLQKSGRPLMMKSFMNRFPYHNPMFTLREEGGRQRPFTGLF